MDNQSHLINEEIRAEVIMLAKATILFEKKNFEQTLKLLADIDCKNLPNSIRSKTLILRSLYETQVEDDRIWDFCANFEAFLHRHRKPRSEAVEATLKFTQIFKMLLRKKSSKEDILRKINEGDTLYFRNWLLEKTTAYKAEFAILRRKRKN